MTTPSAARDSEPATGAERPPRTIFDLLFGSHAAVDVVAQALDGPAGQGVRTAVGQLPARLHKPINDELAVAIAGLLQPNLVNILIDAWRTYDDLVAAARRSLSVSGSTELVDLVNQTVTYTARPEVELVVDRTGRWKVQLVVNVVFTIDALVAVVHAGCLTALRSGHAVVQGNLEVEGVHVQSREAPIDLDLIFTLGTSIPLVPQPTTVALPEQR
jgi:hypothetical protein